MTTTKKIAVLGTGANGSCTAADLARTGHDVVLIDQWPAHVEAMRQNGLRIDMPEETLEVPVEAHHLCDVCTLNQVYDVVLLYVKAYDTRWACELRSEEHTSELQSLMRISYAVFCLKKQHTHKHTPPQLIHY